MATTQIDIKGVFDKDTGQLTGFASSSAPELSLTSLISGAGTGLTVDGIPDPRSRAAIQATLIEPGYTDKFFVSANPKRVVAVGTNSAATNANISVSTAFKQTTTNVQGATDPVLMRFADIRSPVLPIQVTSGTSAAGIFIEVF